MRLSHRLCALAAALLMAASLQALAEDAASPAAAPLPQSPVLPDQPILADPPTETPAPQAVNPKAQETERERRFLQQDPEAYSIVSVGKGLSTHKPMYVLPLTFSPDYKGNETEVEFQLSAKQRVFDWNLYFGYTQKSFWQMYNKGKSAPFRASTYNPEAFYRWTPDPAKFNYWGADFGLEHESNGEGVADSRSWNRIYVAPFQAKGHHLVYLKLWYRLPEKEKTDPTSSEGDDNPDISHYYGYAELQYQHQLKHKQEFWMMARMNPATGKGALSMTYSWPDKSESLFWCVHLWQGYGESISDYNDSVTRIGVGVMFAR